MATVEKQPITAEEFLKMPGPADGTALELVRGEIVAIPGPGLEHGEVQGNVWGVIKNFLKTHPLGRVFVESGVSTERGPDMVRGPDVSYYSKERLPLDQRVTGYHDQAPDLCVEVVSPSNTVRELRAKAKEYLFAGVRIVWLVDPKNHEVSIVTEPLEYRTLEAEATLDGGDVLPGFTCKVAELFE